MTEYALPPLTINKNNFPTTCKAYIIGRIKYTLPDSVFFDSYRTESSKGINKNSTNDKEDLYLAQNAHRVADFMDTLGNCYTGTKHALWTSGVLEDYADMPRGSAYRAIDYFDKNPAKFQKIKSKGEKFTTEELKGLPAGYIVVYQKDGTDGHISITTGNGQGMSDTFDNMKWLDERGPNASVHVYKLSDGWKYNPNTKKLFFEETK